MPLPVLKVEYTDQGGTSVENPYGAQIPVSPQPTSPDSTSVYRVTPQPTTVSTLSPLAVTRLVAPSSGPSGIISGQPAGIGTQPGSTTSPGGVATSAPGTFVSGGGSPAPSDSGPSSPLPSGGAWVNPEAGQIPIGYRAPTTEEVTTCTRECIARAIQAGWKETSIFSRDDLISGCKKTCSQPIWQGKPAGGTALPTTTPTRTTFPGTGLPSVQATMPVPTPTVIGTPSLTIPTFPGTTQPGGITAPSLTAPTSDLVRRTGAFTVPQGAQIPSGVTWGGAPRTFSPGSVPQGVDTTLEPSSPVVEGQWGVEPQPDYSSYWPTTSEDFVQKSITAPSSDLVSEVKAPPSAGRAMTVSPGQLVSPSKAIPSKVAAQMTTAAAAQAAADEKKDNTKYLVIGLVAAAAVLLLMGSKS